MKLTILILLFVSSAIAGDFTPESLKGKYESLDRNCAFDTAEVRLTRTGGDQILRVKLTDTRTGKIALNTVNLETLWTKVKTTRGLRRVILQSRIQDQAIITEEKECTLGWLKCGDSQITDSVALRNQEFLEILVNSESACTYRRI